MLPRLPLDHLDPDAEAAEAAEDPLERTILLREGVRDFRPRSRGWRTAR